jgi:hypothetical protein
MPSDYERRIELRFSGSESDPLLAVAVAQKNPDNLRPDVSSDNSKLTLKPMLLNPGDSFRLTVHLRGRFRPPIIDGRIAGLREISQAQVGQSDSKNDIRRTITDIGLGAAFAGIYAYLLFFGISPASTPLRLVPRKALIIASVIAWIGSLRLLADPLVVDGQGFLPKVARIAINLVAMLAVTPLLWRLRHLQHEYKIVPVAH